MRNRARAGLATIIAGIALLAITGPASAAGTTEIPEVVITGVPHHAEAKVGVLHMTPTDFDALFSSSCEVLSTYDRENNGYENPYADFLDAPGGKTIPMYTGGQGRAFPVPAKFGPSVDGYVLVAEPAYEEQDDGWHEPGAEMAFTGGWVQETKLVDRGPTEDQYGDLCGSVEETVAAAHLAFGAEEVAEEPAVDESVSPAPASPDGEAPADVQAVGTTDQGGSSPATAIAIGVAVVAVLVAAWALLRGRKKTHRG